MLLATGDRLGCKQAAAPSPAPGAVSTPSLGRQHSEGRGPACRPGPRGPPSRGLGGSWCCPASSSFVAVSSSAALWPGNAVEGLALPAAPSALACRAWRCADGRPSRFWVFALGTHCPARSARGLSWSSGPAWTPQCPAAAAPRPRLLRCPSLPGTVSSSRSGMSLSQLWPGPWHLQGPAVPGWCSVNVRW